MKSFLSGLKTGRGHKPARGQKMARGQSLVELALTMPVLLLIVAGTVEVTNLLTIYNEVQVAAREAARFAAQGGPDNTVMNVVKQSILQTPVVPTDPEMNVWVARPVLSVTNAPCTTTCTYTWSEYADNCVFPVNGAGVGTCTNTNPITSSKILADLTSIKDDAFDGKRFVVVVIRYEAQTILNLKFFGNTNGRFPVYAYGVMKQEVAQLASNQLTSGCSAYPIAIDDAAMDTHEDKSTTLTWNNLNGSRTGNFGFLSWRLVAGDLLPTALTSNAAPPNSGSLRYPGNSLAIQSAAHSYYIDATHNQLLRGSIVYSNPATVTQANANTTLDDLKTTFGANKPVAIRVITYTASATNPTTTGESGFSTIYHYTISGFAIIRITGWATNSLTIKWVAWDSSCGFPAN